MDAAFYRREIDAIIQSGMQSRRISVQQQFRIWDVMPKRRELTWL